MEWESALGQLAELLDGGTAEEGKEQIALLINTIQGDSERLYRLAELLRDKGQLEEASRLFQRLLNQAPNHIDGYIRLAMTLAASGEHNAAERCNRRALALAPDNVIVLHNLGVSLLKSNQAEEALTMLQRAVTLQPAFTMALMNRAAAYSALHRDGEAIEDYRRVIEREPDNYQAMGRLGVCYSRVGDPPQVRKWCEKSLQGAPAQPELWGILGQLHTESGQLDLAIQAYREVMKYQPDSYSALLQIIYNNTRCAIWRLTESELRRYQTLLDELRSGGADVYPYIPPFQLLNLIDEPPLHLSASRRSASQFHAEPCVHHFNQTPERLKVAYLSSDYHQHPTAFLIAEVIERHNRDRFEIFALNNGHSDDTSPIRQRLEQGFDHFIDITRMSDRQVAEWMTQRGIHIAVDMMGYTLRSRPGILACRPAPVQLHYLVYPGTLALPHIDYLIADREVIPQGERRYYDESILYLPHCYQPNDRNTPIAVRPTRGELGLPKEAFIFCCFNGTHKIVPVQFQLWCEILKRVPKGILWLLAGNNWVEENLRLEAQRCGVDPKRLYFAAPKPHDQHLARISVVDLTLDTLPYNAHTTASDSLRMGVPVVTCRGRSFASRVAASLLQAVAMPELITDSRDEYSRLAIGLATDSKRHQRVRERLAEQIPTAPLFDTPLYTQNLELAYSEAWRRYLAEEGRSDVDISGLSRS